MAFQRLPVYRGSHLRQQKYWGSGSWQGVRVKAGSRLSCAMAAYDMTMTVRVSYTSAQSVNKHVHSSVLRGLHDLKTSGVRLRIQ